MYVTARKIITDNYAVIMDGTYWDADARKRCKQYFNECCKKGQIKSNYEDQLWRTDNEVNPCSINFDLKREKYLSHGMKYIRMQHSEMINAMKTYAIWCMGTYSFNGIQSRIRWIKKVLEHIGEKNLSLEGGASYCLKEFLEFIMISQKDIKSVTNRIKFKKRTERGRRELKPIITYEAAAERSRNLMFHGTYEERIKFFPVYLITNFGARLPLRATEWTVTPFECLGKNEDGVTFTARRTNQKKHGRKIGNDIDSDYNLFVYSLPYTEVMQMIEWYREETKEHKRRFLFDYDETSLRDSLRKRFSLDSLNDLIKEFVDTYMNDSEDLSWIRYLYGIERFEAFTAGDMRPIALINLYFSGASLDICMELADHDSMETTYHYITNVKEVIEASQFMKMQKRINRERRVVELQEQKAIVEQKHMKPGCNSLKPSKGDTSDCDLRCVGSKHCVVCRHCNPTEQMKKEFVEEKKQQLDVMVSEMQDYIKSNSAETFDRKLIYLQKAYEGYEDACEIKAKEEYEKWKAMKEGRWNGI